MPKQDWGTKRVCPTTGKRFYDLNASPIISPYTGDVVALETGKNRTMVADAEDAQTKKAAAAAKPAADEDLLLDDSEDDDEDDVDLGDEVLEDDEEDDTVSFDELKDVAADDD